ncbi:MAG: SPOR domain-containing protein [Alphaproteobacteria bacterium]|jgi:hypothetical protein|nr:SPOR domain-containing protein [Alphaproteobacteria bacterium]
MPKRNDFDDEGFLESILKRNGTTPMPPSMARLLLMVAGLAVVATIAAVTWATWPGDKSRVDEDTLPIMRVDPTVYKIKPEDPGGMMVPNKDSTIFESLGEERSEKTVENLLDESEVPMKKEDIFSTEQSSEPEEEVVSSYEVVESKPEIKPEVKQEVKQEVKPEPVKVEKVEPEKVEEKPIVSKIEPMKMTTGKSYVQFAAVKSDADAKAKWSKLQSQYPELKTLSLHVQRADLGSKGIFYRVQSGPMSLEQAQDVCTKIKAAKGDCLVIK